MNTRKTIHDLKSALGAIAMAIEVVEGSVQPTHREMLALMHRNIEMALALVDEISEEEK